MYNREMVRLTTLLILVAATAPSTRPQFVEVAPAAGLAFRHSSGGAEKDYTLETVGGGVAWLDYDRDGWLDLYFTNAGPWEDLASGKRSVRNALYRNRGDGTFEDVTEKAGVGGPRWAMGAAAADYDNDGWPDLYVVNYGPNTLYRNRGDGTFEDVTEKAGVGDPSWGSSAGFADYDGDGRLDLYVANYVRFDANNPPPPRCQYRGITVHCGPKGMTAADDVLYRGNPDGTFTDVSQTAGVRVEPAYGLGVGWADLDDDGDLDLFVANDSMGNFLFENQGGKFEEIGLLAGVAYSEDGNAQAGMGVAVGDFDRDGRLDLYVTNFADDYNTLYRNLGGMVFRDVTYAADLAFPTWQDLAWGTFFFDFDNDGWLDLFAANGHIYPQVDRYQIGTSYLQSNRLSRNLGGGKFEDATGRAGPGLKEAWSSRGAAFADFDNDGDLDVAVNNQDAAPSLLRNEGGSAAGHWLGLRLEGVSSNRDAVGGRVRVETSEGFQIQERAAGSSFQAGHDDRLHFGLGLQATAKSVTVRWPGGKTQSFSDVAADSFYRLREGGTLEPVAGAGKSGAREAAP